MNAPWTTADSDRVEAYCKGIASGPWSAWLDVRPNKAYISHAAIAGTVIGPADMREQDVRPLEIASVRCAINPGGAFVHNNTAIFIAHARTDLPLAVAAIAERDAEIGRLRESMKAAMDALHGFAAKGVGQ
jgi:hypothetical protein